MAGGAGISVATLWRWKRRIEGTGAGDVGPAEPVVAAPGVQFVPLTIRSAVEGPESRASGVRVASFELVLVGGATLVIPVTFSSESLERLLGILVRAC